MGENKDLKNMKADREKKKCSKKNRQNAEKAESHGRER